MWRIALVHAVFFSACLLPAQDTSPRVGQRVVTKYLTPLRLNKPVGSDAVFRVYKVERAEDGWLRLVAGDISGWVRAGDVVPFDQAIDFYNREIRTKPCPTMARPSDSTPRTPRPIATEDSHGTQRRTTRRPSPTTTRPSDLIPRTHRHSSTGGSSGTPSGITTRRSPTSAR
jgi:hypothetical protein